MVKKKLAMQSAVLVCVPFTSSNMENGLQISGKWFCYRQQKSRMYYVCIYMYVYQSLHLYT